MKHFFPKRDKRKVRQAAVNLKAIVYSEYTSIMRLETLVDIFHIEHQEILIKVFKNELEYSLINAATV